MLYSNACITEAEVIDAQSAWGDGIVRIGRVHRDDGDYVAAAKDHIQTYYGYDLGSVLGRISAWKNDFIPPGGVPDSEDEYDQAAAILLQGLTAWALLRVSASVRQGETVVVEAAAGGTGTLAVQLAKSMGARVIGLASTVEKRELVERLGADATVWVMPEAA